MTHAVQRCARCRGLVVWATTAAGKSIPLDPEPIPRDQVTRGALVLIGNKALGRADAVRRLGQLFDLTDEKADLAIREYPWHVAHFATCTRPNLRDEP